MSRKDRLLKNLGGEAAAALVTPAPGGATVMRTNVVLIERIILSILRTEVDRLSKDEEECTRFFSHFFDPIVGPDERKQFATNFQNRPPNVVLGYPRTTADFPCVSVVLASDDETQNAVGDYISQTEPDEKGPAEEYVGAIFTQSHMIYVYAEHPDVVIYLYQFVKLCLFGAKQALLEAGCTEIVLSGGELSPDQGYIPENMFVRYLQLRANTLITVPKLLAYDPRRLRITGIFMDDQVVDGVRGGVTPYAASETDDGEIT